MVLYQILIFIFLSLLAFIPVQIDIRINYGIFILAFLLIPIFVKNFIFDIKSKNPITIFFLLFLTASALSTMFSIDQKRSLITFFTYVSYFIIFTSIRSIFPDLKSKKLLVTGYMLLVTLLSIISLYNTLILKYVNKEQEGVSFMWIYYGHNHLATMLLFAIPFAFYFLRTYWKSKRIRAALLVTCILLLVTFLFTLARSSMLPFLISLLLTFVIFSKVLKAKIATILPVAAGFLLFILIFGFMNQNKNFLIRKFRIPLNFKYSRIIYWNQAISNFRENPIFGTGLDTFRYINRKAPRVKGVVGSYFVHNFFLQMLSDAGILGFVTSLMLILNVLWLGVLKVYESKDFFYISLFVGMLASSLMAMLDMGWSLPTVFLIFWVIVGITISRNG